MLKKITLPEEQLNDCRELLSRYFTEQARDQFEEALDAGNYDIIIKTLKEALSTKNFQGFPCGKQGTPTERFAAESIIKRIEKAGYGGPTAG